MRVFSTASLLTILLSSQSVLLAQTSHPPVAAAIGASSLYRGDPAWIVTTTILLKATETDAITPGTEWDFHFLHPEALKDPSGASRLECQLPGATSFTPLPDNGTIKATQVTVQCRYHPPVQFTGDDVVEFEV